MPIKRKIIYLMKYQRIHFFASAVVYFGESWDGIWLNSGRKIHYSGRKKWILWYFIKYHIFFVENLHILWRILRLGHTTQTRRTRFALCAKTLIFFEDYEGFRQGNCYIWWDFRGIIFCVPCSVFWRILGRDLMKFQRIHFLRPLYRISVTWCSPNVPKWHNVPDARVNWWSASLCQL